MARLSPRELEVIGSEYITPHMLRVTLGGTALAGFPDDQESAYIKLLLPQDDSDTPVMRTYTVRKQRADAIDVDFALHDAPGPASSWAVTARPGDRILIGGPGPKKLLNPEADWFLLAGDMTALPAISVNLSLLPDDARGYAVLEVMTSDDIQPLTCPPGIELIWVVNPEPGADHHPLLEQVEQLAWHEGQPAVWAACEFSSMRALRRYFKQQRQLPKSHLYISSYWKVGSSETQHKIIKREDEEQELAGG